MKKERLVYARKKPHRRGTARLGRTNSGERNTHIKTLRTRLYLREREKELVEGIGNLAWPLKGHRGGKWEYLNPREKTKQWKEKPLILRSFTHASKKDIRAGGSTEDQDIKEGQTDAGEGKDLISRSGRKSIMTS